MVNICRLCATLRKDEQLVTIEDTKNEICHKLLKCCQVEILIDDLLPKCVCLSCIEALQQAYAFYVKVHESQESLAVFYPTSKAKNDEVSENAAPVEKSVPVVLKEQKVQLTASNNKETNTEIVADKSDGQISPTVTKVETDDATEQLQVISIIEGDEETTFILEETLEEDIDDEEMLVEKILERRNDAEVDHQSDDNYSRLVAEVDETPAIENSVKKLKGSLNRKFSKRLTSNKPKSEMQELLDEMILEEKEIEAVQCSDVGASNETWSSYSWSCHLCESEESCFANLVLHCQFQHGISDADMQFKCADCQKVGLRYNNFVNHVRFRHRSSLALCCDVCDVHCVDFEMLAIHRHIRHANDKEYPLILLCGECGRGFSNQNSLTVHKKAHSDKQRFECSQCSALFKRMNGLKAHQKVHSDVKEYSCEHCGKSFRQKVNLEAHWYTHSDDKPYECSICKKSCFHCSHKVSFQLNDYQKVTFPTFLDKSFKTSMSLMKHNETHSDIKQFNCDHCKKSFRTKDAKLSHERTHTGEMPYTCEYCMRPFRFRSTYLGHLNTHTGNRPYSCLTCDHHFTNWSNYNKHMKRRHAGDKTGQTKKPTSQSKKKPRVSLFEYEEDVAEVVEAPATSSGMLVEEYSNALDEALDEDHISIIYKGPC